MSRPFIYGRNLVMKTLTRQRMKFVINDTDMTGPLYNSIRFNTFSILEIGF